jgi:hypothetical protein
VRGEYRGATTARLISVATYEALPLALSEMVDLSNIANVDRAPRPVESDLRYTPPGWRERRYVPARSLPPSGGMTSAKARSHLVQ